MDWSAALALRPGITAVAGSGGKTTLLETLGWELAAGGKRVVLCTTTKFLPFPGIETLTGAGEAALERELAVHRLVCVGEPVPGTGKLALPGLALERLAALADFVLVEADGSAGRPLKAHASYEPVIPPGAGQVILVVGASGLGRPILEAAHRPELFARLAGVTPESPASPEAAAAVLRAENLGDQVFINQADTPERLAQARALAALLDRPVLVGALRKGVWERC